MLKHEASHRPLFNTGVIGFLAALRNDKNDTVPYPAHNNKQPCHADVGSIL